MIRCFLLMILLASGSLFSQDEILGYWLSEDERAVINITKDKDIYSGAIVWLYVQHTGEVKIPLDINNDDKEQQKRKLIGMNILTNFKFKDGEYSGGKVYDPKSGNTYKAYMKLQKDNRIKLRGYIGFSLFGRTSFWTRQKNSTPDKYVLKK